MLGKYNFVLLSIGLAGSIFADENLSLLNCESNYCDLLIQSVEKGIHPEYADEQSNPSLKLKIHEIETIEQSGTTFKIGVGQCKLYVEYACLKGRPCAFYDMQEKSCIRF